MPTIKFWILCLKLAVSASFLVPWLWFVPCKVLHVSLLSMCLNVWLWITRPVNGSITFISVIECATCYLPLYETQMQAANPRKSPRDTSFAPQVLQQLKSFVLLHFLQVKHPVESVRGDPSSYQIIQAQRRVTKALTAIRQWETLTVWQRTSIA